LAWHQITFAVPFLEVGPGFVLLFSLLACLAASGFADAGFFAGDAGFFAGFFAGGMGWHAHV
jgi:hypothetical protein